jgi:hypothetical protein
MALFLAQASGAAANEIKVAIAAIKTEYLPICLCLFILLSPVRLSVFGNRLTFRLTRGR